MKELQAQVAKAVADRGYREGWTPEQYAARQICKAVEELDELAKAIQWKRHPTYGSSLVPLWAQSLSDAAFEAEGDFDNDSAARPWDDVDDLRLADAIKELPDVIIPLLVLAETLGIDLGQAIREKALGDVARGVRGEKPDYSKCPSCGGRLWMDDKSATQLCHCWGTPEAEKVQAAANYWCANCDRVAKYEKLKAGERLGQQESQSERLAVERLEEIGQYAALLFENGDESGPVIDELLAEVERLNAEREWWCSQCGKDMDASEAKRRLADEGAVYCDACKQWWIDNPPPIEQGQWVPLSELRAGAVFETQDGARAVKGEYRYLTSPLFGVVLLVDGSAVVFGNVDVREIVI